MTTIAGTNVQGSTDGTGTSAKFKRPTGLTTDGTNLYVSDLRNHLIRKISNVSSQTVYVPFGISGNDNTSHTYTGLDNATSYYYRIAAVNSSGTGHLSSEVNALTIPAIPDNISATGGLNQVSLSWNSVTGADNYTIYWDNSSNVTSSSNSINITNTSYTHTRMDNGTNYYYKIASVNSSGTGSLSSEVKSPYYSFNSQLLSWENANNYCVEKGGYLVSLNSSSEHTLATQICKDNAGTGSGKDCWIGLNDIDTEGTLQWASGETYPANGHTFNVDWNIASRDCFIFVGLYADGRIEGKACDTSIKSICEHP